MFLIGFKWNNIHIFQNQPNFKENEERRKELNLAMPRLELGLVRGFSKLKGAENV